MESSLKWFPPRRLKLSEAIELVVQVLDEVLRFARRELRIGHVAATDQLFLKRVQGPNDAIRA